MDYGKPHKCFLHWIGKIWRGRKDMRMRTLEVALTGHLLCLGEERGLH